MDSVCVICNESANEDNPFFKCDFCQKHFHNECNLPLALNAKKVGSCLDCTCMLFPFSICYDLTSDNFRFNYFHPLFSDINTIKKICESNNDYNINAIDCNFLIVMILTLLTLTLLLYLFSILIFLLCRSI